MLKIRFYLTFFIAKILLSIPVRFSQHRTYCWLLTIGQFFLPKEGKYTKPVLFGNSDFEWDFGINSCRGNYILGTNSRHISHIVVELIKKFKKVHFIDCGANIGIFSRLAMDTGAFSVIAIEPQSALALRLRQWTLVDHCAISDKEGIVELYIPGRSVGEASIDSNHIRKNLEAFNDSRTESVVTKPLSLFVQNEYANILKIDVEGHELSAIASLGETIKLVNAIIVEIEHINLILLNNILSTNGFVPVYFDFESKMFVELDLMLNKYTYKDAIFIKEIDL